MKMLNQILSKIAIKKTLGELPESINSIAFDSRSISENDLFVAIKGTQVDGHNFINQVIDNGASVVVCEDAPKEFLGKCCFIVVEDTNIALEELSSAYFDHPAAKLKLVGVTGTNGKTTTASLLFDLYTELGYDCGLLSTIENRIKGKVVEATHTTPDPIQINKLIAEMVENGVSHCFMEVSSHAIDQSRISGSRFALGIFTNISHDHLDYHKTFDAYIKAKKKFFDELPKTAFALSNFDDKRGMVMLQNTKAEKHTYGLNGVADFNCKIIENQFDGLQLQIEHQSVWFKLIGKFNAYNLMAIYATAVLLGEDKLEVLAKLSNLDTAEGRFEQIRTPNNISVIIDYAHTPDALKNVLSTISSIRTGNESLITLVGAGGNRDAAKRPKMAKIAVDLSDRVILTSDNPRFEDPEVILEDMRKGVDAVGIRKVLSITNRKEAIRTAIALANSGDIILIAGKGHEKYQVIKDEKVPFDEKEIVNELLKN
ncbi:MAG: UDP-N-acetylmuramoyl-L-alanyl-D-glutamate--2,6-diaminopimelate ligase [Bacteroidetes bacterium]|nr:UDP-N-acetylmuramoyl-L-alanyl-D-glutamate--2,6-diaminopimelate ligase [Bacteroidota bacterium]